jgi:hypothetical protein
LVSPKVKITEEPGTSTISLEYDGVGTVTVTDSLSAAQGASPENRLRLPIPCSRGTGCRVVEIAASAVGGPAAAQRLACRIGYVWLMEPAAYSIGNGVVTLPYSDIYSLRLSASGMCSAKSED